MYHGVEVSMPCGQVSMHKSGLTPRQLTEGEDTTTTFLGFDSMLSGEK
jgi:hypothetical protein